VTTVVLHLRTGDALSAAGDECHQGTGSEVCAWDVKVTAGGGVSVVTGSIAAAPGQDVVFHQPSDNEILANGGDPIHGDLGTLALFSFDVATGAAGGELRAEAKWVDSQLQLQQLASAALAQVGAPDADGDGVPDDLDACPSYANAMPLTDGNRDDIPDDCNCGNANLDRRLNAQDSLRIKQCVVGLRDDCAADIADTNGNGVVNTLDARRVEQVAVSLRPSWELTCARRPQGSEPPPLAGACAVAGVTCSL
jgi:hypothetical protein